jgi:transcriptional regulator with XRE-family HTH domain
MNESRNNLRNSLVVEFEDKDYRESYAEDYLHSFIAMQFRAVREQRDMTQAELAQAIHTKQTAISRLESVNNRSRNLNLLQKAAFALGCRLRVSLETFGSLIDDEGPRFSREMLQRPGFDDEFENSEKATKACASKARTFRLHATRSLPSRNRRDRNKLKRKAPKTQF